MNQKAKTKYGFVGTCGLVLMVASGSFTAGYACYVVRKLMNGLMFEQSGPMLTTLFTAGVLPYCAGLMMFKLGKKTR